MAHFVYTSALSKLLTATLGNLTSVTVKCAAVTSAYTPAQTTDDTLTDLGSSVIEAVTLRNVTVTDGILICDNFEFTGTNSGTCVAFVYYISTGVPSTSYLLSYDGDVTNLPVTFSGSVVAVSVPSSGLISLAAV